MGKMIATERVVGTVPMKYSENRLMLNEGLASGEIEGKKFEVHNAFGSIYVTFSDLKGDLPKMEVNLRDFVQAAYDTAVKENLFK